MKKILLLAVFLTIQFLGLRALATDTNLSCTPTITTGTISSNTICAGTVIGVPFVLTDCVDPGNVFTVQLSDATGNFASPTNIGSSAGTTSGTIVAIIPPSISFGSGYRIRVVCSSPLTNGTDNGVDLVLLPKPNATFSINNNIQCINGNSFTYTNTSTGSITSYNWKLGDGIATTQTSVVYTYATSGTFSVMLTATGTNGCKDSVTQTVTVQPKPVADFSYTGPNLCSTPDFNFTNTTSSTGTLSSYWYFGDGDTSTSQNPNHTYVTAGTYSVKLRVQSSNGCIDSITKTINVLDKPTASFLVNSNSQCLSGNNFSFPNFSTGVGNTYLWQFGDGTTSTAINATKTYLNIGTYTVKLIVTNINGCKDSTTQDVDVTSSPVVSFTSGNTLCSIGLNVLFNNSSSGVNSYNWSFGDGTFSNTTNPSKTYATAGTYNVKLVATGSGGCKDSVTQTIAVDSKASADFSINNTTQCINSNLFTFTNNTTGAFISSAWSFGDGVTSILTSPSKAYTVAGNYLVKLVITNANACVDSVSKSITVADKPIPTFTVAGNTSCSSTLNVSMTNTSTGVGNTYVWDFGDGTNSTLVNPGKTYASTGSYVIRLVATNFAGCRDSTERSLTFATKPTASFTVNSNIQCTVSNTFTFTNTSVGGSIYNWSFGDGFTSTATNPTKQYITAGTYTVKLVVTNVSGCKDSITQVVSILAKPTPDFTISGGTGCSSNLTIQLINLSSGSSPSYSWDFGDGTTSTSTNPSKTYAAVGTYTIKLVVTNGNGCKDSISTNFTVSTKPVVNFTINNSNQCENSNLFTFTNTTTGASTYNWSFGDGFASTAANPTKQYTATGTYTVKLVATNSNGCTDSISKTVTVVPKPNAGFTISGATGCTNNRTISFNNTSTGTGNTYSWDFGDGNTSTATSPTTTYAGAGTYAIKLVVTNINGCKDSTTQIITFNAFPVAAISLAGGTNATQCFNGNSFVFNGSPVSGVTYNWSLGDGGISTIINPTKSYSSVGNYTIKLVVTNSLGCKDSTTTTVTVLTSPTASYTYLGATGCTVNRTLNFTNTSTGAGLYLWGFGDNTSTSSVSPTKTYATTAGNYNVQLLALNANGCRDSVTQIVSFKNLSTAAIAFAGNTSQCINNNAYLFVDNSSNASTYIWNFGDGTTSTLKNPSVKVYTVAGSYTVKHFATSIDGCTDSTTLNVNILSAPIPNFTISGLNNCGINLPVTFTNTSTGTGNTYLWRFGDGATSTATSPTKTYTVTGSYNVKLIVTSANGCADSVTQIVQFAPKVTAGINLNIDGSFIAVPPSGAGSSKCFKENNFAFQNVTTGSNGSTTYLWEYGDGTTSTLANPPAHSYSSVGTYSMKLTATNANGCVDSVRRTVSVFGNPVPDFAINGGGCTNSLSINLTNTSAPANGLVSSNWNFGDATTSTDNNPTKLYSTKGTYQIRLIINDAYCKDSLIKPVSFLQVPTVGINVLSNRNQCLNSNSYTVSNNSLFTTSYLWLFGDGTTSISPTPPAKTYTVEGNYIVKLIGTTIDGCKDSTTESVTVITNPTAAFNSTYQSCTNTNSVMFANTSTNATSYMWSFGDGVDSTSTNPTHTYASLGTYTIKLVAMNASGCKDSTTRIITLIAKPTAGIASPLGQNSTQCLTNNSFTFTDNSIGAISHSWNFGDGSTSSLANPSAHSYVAAGVYVVKLIVTNANGCKDSTSINVTVLSNPIASFSLIGATSCTANTSITTNNTTTGLNNIYSWDLGDGNSSLVTNPSHTYTIAGTYNIKLVATNLLTGCKDSVTKPVTFSTNPIATFIVNNSNQCVNNNSFVFTNTSAGGATYSWNFGDATTSTLTSPVKAFTVAGVYSVKLIVTTANGCKDSVTQVVTVFAKPAPSFNVVGSTNCSSNLTITLNNTTPAALGTTYLWNFGDGTNSSAANPSKTYSSFGTYTIKLVVVNGNGCVDSITRDITISSKPIAAFTVSDTIQCSSGIAIAFTDASTNIATPAYYYDFGDGTFSLVQNPTKSYTTAGTYIVKMVVTNANGCKDSTTKTIRIVAKPVASFTIPNYNGCGNVATSFTFSNSSANATSYVWDFGDGTTSSLTSPTKIYTTTGTFIVKLVVSNANGCKDSSTQTISFIAKPIAGFTVNSTGTCSNNTFTFTDTSIITGTSNYYYYDFGDGTFSLLQNPTKVFASAGIYKVVLFVTNANGCKDSTIKTIVVAAKPTASFSIANYTSCSNNNTLSFVNTSVNATSYVWNFGDGVDSTSTNPTHTYLSLGTYNVKLVVTNASGCKDSATQNINLIAKPIVAFSYTSSGLCSNNTFTFTDASIVNGVATYYYDFGDGTFSLAKNPTKVFATAGTYKVVLFVTNTNGCKDSLSKMITVTTAPKAAFTLSNFDPCSNNYTVTTVNSSTNATSYFWDFGDGILTSQTNITKTFAGTGTYTITLIATNAGGCTDTARRTISFTTKPIAAFNVSSLGGCVNNGFSFSDNSTVSGTPSYYYNFGDGVISLLPNTTHSYSIAGTYKVIYVVTNSNGCKDSTNQTLIVTAKPKAGFTTPNTGWCSNNNTFSFTNTSNNAVSYIWDFGDGTGATTTNATKTFAGTGIFVVKLIAISATGCSDTTSQTFTIIPKPIAFFNVSSLGGCVNNSFTFSDNSTVNGVANYMYDFGDATISLLQNPTHTYTAAGIYKVLLYVTNANGCKDSTSRIITVTSKPIALFSLSGIVPCTNNNTITLVNSSTNATSYVWNFGDGNGSTSTNPTKTYAISGTYKITLLATNSNGCVDSTSQTITLTNKPSAAFTVSSTSQCLTSNSFVFASVSTGNISSYFWNFGDGTNSSASNPTKIYNAQGVYNVTLTVTNANGCTDVATQVVNVTGKPIISYTVNNASQCIIGNVFTFTNTSPNQIGITYYWNFGDGILSSLNTISKVYTSTGTFSVSLIGVNANGCVDSLLRTVNVLAKPAPSFNVSSSVQCVNNSFVFTNTTTNTATNYIWKFGDGNTSTATSPTYSYTVGGTYVVTLIASNAGGCVDSASKTIFVTSKPTASFTTSINNICSDPATVTFNNTTTGSFSSLIWAFSDGTISTDISPVKTFATAGTYTAKLLVLSNGGCRDSVSKSFTILPKLSAVFSFNSITQCINNNSFIFTNATNNTGLNSYTYKWDLGDGTFASTSAVTKSYLLPGNYTVKLLIENDTTGCRDSVSQVVSVNAQPTATISGNGTICQGNSFVINTTFTGTPPFSFTYTDGTSNYFVSNVTTNLYGLGVSPLVTSTYNIISMNDAYCSASTAQVTSTKSIVRVDTAKFTTQPISKASCVGNTVLFSTKVSTNALVTYQWQKNGVDIIGAYSDSLKLTNITSLDSGTYRLVVVLACGSIYSNNAALVVNQPAVPPIYTAAVKYCQLDTAKPLVASGNILTWYSIATGGLGTPIAPVPNTLIVGTQTYWVSNNNLTNCESARYPVTITILPKPTVSLIALGKTELQPTQTVLLKATASANALGIRWYYNDLPIGTFPGNQNLVGFSGVGKYQVDALTAEGCTARSEVIQVTSPTGLASASEGNNLRLYPNPATSFVNMYFDNPLNQDATVRLITATGQILQSKAVKFTNRFQRVQLYVANLRADVYAIEVINSRGFTIARNLFIKAK
jgi:PKD repeat protein